MSHARFLLPFPRDITRCSLGVALIAGAAGITALAAPLAAQGSAQGPVTTPASRPTWFGVPINMQGEISMFGEVYGISGREARRPGETGRLLFQPTFEISRFLKVGLDLQLTTEGAVAGAGARNPHLSAARQRLNQIGISPTWSWGRVDLGDFSDSYTPYTFSGVRLRGVGASVNPGLLRLGMFRGSARTAVLGMATNTAFARTLSGGRVGVGSANGSFLDLILIRGRDDAGSLPAAGDSAFYDPRLDDPTVDPDTLAVGTIINPLSVTPQDNVVAAAAGRLILMDGRIRLQGELSGAAHTRDVRASALDNEAVLAEIPGFLRGLFTPRVGSSFGAAYTTTADVRFGSFSGNATFRQVDPGYVSLGVASLMNDQRGWGLSGTQRIGRAASIRLDAGRQHDNLIGQKAFTTNRDRFGAMLNLRPTPRLSSSLRMQFVGMRNGVAAGDPQQIAYGNWILATTQTFSLGRDRLLRSVGVGYTFRNSGDDNPLRAAASLSVHSATVRAVFAPWEAVSLTPSLGLVQTRSGAEDVTRVRRTYGIAAQMRLQEGRWTSSVSLGSTADRGAGAFQTRIASRYDLTEASTVTFSLRESRFRNAPNPFGPPGGFQERAVTLQLTRRIGSGR
jgi:hypothetical protein